MTRPYMGTGTTPMKMSLLVLFSLISGILQLTSAQLHPPYMERFHILAEMLQQARSTSDNDVTSAQDAYHLVQSLLALPPSALQDAVMKSVKSLTENGGESADVLTSENQQFGAVPSNATMSVLCLNSTEYTLGALMSGQSWAVEMLDAMGKPGPAIKDFNVVWPGAFSYCRTVRSNNTAPSFKGQYCNAALEVPGVMSEAKMSIILGLCIPDTCSSMDYTLLLNDVLAQLNVSLPAAVTCPQPKKELDTRAIVATVICSIILTLMVLGTLVDILLIQWPKWSVKENEKPYISANGCSCVDGEQEPLLSRAMVQIPEPGICVKLFLAFSVYTNGAKLLTTKQAPGNLSCIHGIRFLSMTWVVLGHAIGSPITLSANAIPYFLELNKRWTFQAISNASVSVDTFFVLSGLLVAYLSLREMKKRQGKLNWFLFFFHRFWRLTPAYMLLLMFSVCLFPYLGKGPFWADEVGDSKFCEQNWWTNLLYVNNLVNSDKMCFGHSWYLANDMQFYILSPLIFVPFFYSPVIGAVISAVFLLVTSIVPGVLTMEKHFPPGLLASVDVNNTNLQDYMNDFYIKPYNRMGPYIVGMLAGYFLYRNDCKLRISWIINLSIWAVATSLALAVLYGLYDASNGHPVTLPVSAFYNAVNRQVWGACVAWVVVACVTGNGGFVNTILSWSALIPLSRLTYCIYLLHIMVIGFYISSMDTVFYFSDINVVCLFLTILVVSCMAAVVASLAFEAPMMGLEKVLLHGDRQTGT